MRALVIGIAIIGFSFSARAQQPLTQPVNPVLVPTANRHLGLLVRPEVGLGYYVVSQPTGSSAGDITLSGGAGMFGVIVGYAVAENFILGAHIFDTVGTNPNVSFSNGGSGGTSNTSISLFGIGPSATYYFPSNYYLTATVHLSRLSLTVNNVDTTLNTGFGARVGVGREWWISDHWGLGVNVHGGYANNSDPNPSASAVSSYLLGFMVSATYN
jgi:hypothetical protein